MSQGECSRLKPAHPYPGEPLQPAPKLFVGNGGDFFLRREPQVGTREELGRSHPSATHLGTGRKMWKDAEA